MNRIELNDVFDISNYTKSSNHFNAPPLRNKYRSNEIISRSHNNNNNNNSSSFFSTKVNSVFKPIKKQKISLDIDYFELRGKRYDKRVLNKISKYKVDLKSKKIKIGEKTIEFKSLNENKLDVIFFRKYLKISNDKFSEVNNVSCYIFIIII